MQPLVERFFRDRMPPNPLVPPPPTPVPPPSPPPKCKNGWKEYKAGEHGEYCKGKGEIAASARYFYQGPEQKSNCLAKCKALGDLCKCCDVGFISDGPPGNMCHFQNKSKDAAPAIHGMEHIKAYVPCKKGG